MLFIDLPGMEVGHVLPQTLLKPSSRSAVTSPFFLALVQRLSRGTMEEGHSAAGDKEERPHIERKPQPPGIPKGE